MKLKRSWFFVFFAILFLFQDYHAFFYQHSRGWSGFFKRQTLSVSTFSIIPQFPFRFSSSSLFSMLLSPEVSESTHLKLSSISCHSCEAENSSNTFSISEFRNRSNDQILLAIAGKNRTKLETLSLHLYGRNIASDDNVDYLEVRFVTPSYFKPITF